MKKLLVNMVFRNIETNSDFRIICIAHDYSNIVCIELNNEKALPYYDNTSNIEAQINNSELELLENDPYFKIYDEGIIPKKFLILRDNAYKYIKELCATENLFDLCDEYKRGFFINKITKDFGVTKRTIYKNMRKFLQCGMTPNSLLPPHYKPKNPNFSVKTGRKREVTQGEGIIIDDNVLLHIKNIYERYFLKVDGATIKQTYHEFLYQYYSYLTVEDGKEIRKILDDDKIPTLRQFKYHLNKIRNIKEEIINKVGKIKYQQNERPTLSREDINIFGPGQLYEIDSTVSDLYLVSNFSRNIVVGKAVLYIIVDVYSRLITGFYTGLEESSWIAAMMAYMNMNENKVEFCKKYNININEEDWPSYGIPSKINTDRGESISKASDQLVKHLGITIENNPPYCPDMKGIVERWFKGINESLQKYIPGGVRKDHKQRGGKDYRSNAVLTIREFNEIVIKHILSYNNTILQSFSMSKDMIDNELLPTPSNIWNYGSANKLLFTTNVPKDKMMLALMPKDKASITRGGILFKGLFYTCDTGLRNEWFLRKPQLPKHVDIAYDPRNLNKIYIYDSKTMSFETCNMLEKSFKDFNDISLDELIKIRSFESKLKKMNNTENISLQINAHHDMKNIIDNAVKRSKKESKLSKRKLMQIPLNKKIEKAIMRREEYFDLDPKKQVNNTSIIDLEKFKVPLLTNDSSSNTDPKTTYDEHNKKYNDENNDLLESIIFGDSENK